MPPIDAVMESIISPQTTKTTNFSIAAIMSGLQQTRKIAEALDIKKEPEELAEQVVTSSSAAEDTAAALKSTPVKKEKKSRIVETSNCSELDGVHCNLDNKELWDKFAEFGTEMIITRTGRRMFPTMRVSFSQLELSEPGTKYLVLLDIVPCDNKRYRYAYHRSAWLVAGKADPPPPHRLYAHPDGPFTADQLRKQVISFEKVKITNNESDHSGQVGHL